VLHLWVAGGQACDSLYAWVHDEIVPVRFGNAPMMMLHPATDGGENSLLYHVQVALDLAERIPIINSLLLRHAIHTDG
jgi:hypothetical protein